MPNDLGAPGSRYCCYIYRDMRPGREGVPIYVGAGLTRSRPDSHWKGTSHNSRLAMIIKEMKGIGLRPIIELAGLFDDIGEAYSLERALIDEFKNTLCNVAGVPSSDIMIEAQCRAARALTGLDQEDLAKRARVSARTIMRFESGQSIPRRVVMDAIERALTDLGVEFLDEDENSGPGVRLRKERSR